MVNLAAESFECSSGNATPHKASLNSDLMQQRTFSQLPRVTGTVSGFTWGRIIKMLKGQMAKAPVEETKQSRVADGTRVTATAGRIVCFLRVEGSIGLVRVERVSYTCSLWAAIKTQMELWPYTSGTAKVRICFIVNNSKNWHLNYDNWSSEVSV